MKKNLCILSFICLLLIAVFSLSACGLFGKGNDATPASDDQIRMVYLAYAESGGKLSYDEWLVSIKGEKGEPGAKGDAGVGIASIEKTATEGLIDTYTITLTDGTTSTFTIKNGKDGTDGKDGKDGKNADGSSVDPDTPTPDEYFCFTLLENDTYAISANDVDLPSQLILPSSHNGKAVTEIGELGFYERGHIEELTIPNSVTIIGGGAFFSCTSLTSITIPEGVMSIGESAFCNCIGLTSIAIPSSVESIGATAFYECVGLSSIAVESGNAIYHSENNCLIETETKTLILGCNTSVIPSDDSVTRIGDRAFYECTGLTSITIPEGVTEIGDYAFFDCKGLTSLTISSSVSSIGQMAFYTYSDLADIIFQGTTEQWNAISKRSDWIILKTSTYTIRCTDGDIAKE